jgi:hypothetical protein
MNSQHGLWIALLYFLGFLTIYERGQILQTASMGKKPRKERSLTFP